jgi:hypothetical protein
MGTPFKMAQPMIPGGLLHQMFEMETGGAIDQEKGGQSFGKLHGFILPSV